MEKGVNNYTEIANYYDQIINGGYYDMPKFASEYKEIIGPQAKEILEIGVGTGGLTMLLKDSYKITGIDFSEPLLSIAKEKLQGSGVALRQIDVRKIDFADIFDAIIGHGSIFIVIESKQGIVVESFLTDKKDVEITLNNIYKSLKSGGVVVWDYHAEHVPGKRFISLPNGNRYEFEIKEIDGMNEFYKLQQIKDAKGKLIAESTDHKIRIPIEEFNTLAKQAGFSKIETRTIQNKYLVLTK
ncbi:MAG: methyltransferase domain-containing protein [Candidatus Taylorbacteria bacterium]